VFFNAKNGFFPVVKEVNALADHLSHPVAQSNQNVLFSIHLYKTSIDSCNTESKTLNTCLSPLILATNHVAFFQALDINSGTISADLYSSLRKDCLLNVCIALIWIYGNVNNGFNTSHPTESLLFRLTMFALILPILLYEDNSLIVSLINGAYHLFHFKSSYSWSDIFQTLCINSKFTLVISSKTFVYFLHFDSSDL